MNYNKVPEMIAAKDLDYLSDMFNWNFNAFKKSINFANQAQDEEIKQTLVRASELFKNNISQVLTMLAGGINE